MKVNFVRPMKSYLPEIAAYKSFLEARGHQVTLHSPDNITHIEADIIWWICGFVPLSARQRFKNAVHVHEYASASIAPLALAKDMVKKVFHPKPDYRVFLNDWVRDRYAYKDGTPFCLRDMGVPNSFFNKVDVANRTYDLIYVGEMSRLAFFIPALKAMQLAGLSLLLVGDVPYELKNILACCSNVEMVGRVSQVEIPTYLSKARAGLNLMPAQSPYIYQTSTKVLEYLAAGLPVVSNSYEWIMSMREAHSSRIYLLKNVSEQDDWLNVMQTIQQIDPCKDDCLDFSWERILSQMPVWKHLNL